MFFLCAAAGAPAFVTGSVYGQGGTDSLLLSQNAANAYWDYLRGDGPWGEGAYKSILRATMSYSWSKDNIPTKVAVADVCGDSTPELLYVGGDIDASAAMGDSWWVGNELRVMSYSEGELHSILNLPLEDNNAMSAYNVFVTQGKKFYVYNNVAQSGVYDTWSRYELKNDRLTVVEKITHSDEHWEIERERWQIDGKNISKDDYDRLTRNLVSETYIIPIEHNASKVEPLWATATQAQLLMLTYDQAMDALESLKNSLKATPTASEVLVNGERGSFDAYNIDGSNYFKLRDLAYVMNGTEKRFEVGWDGANNAIALTSGKPYTSVGGEMTGKGTGEKIPNATTSKITLNGDEVSFTAYNIDGNNYFKLRDIGETFDFGVTWDGARNTIVIDTSKGYTPE
jgi:hypothetical protein